MPKFGKWTRYEVQATTAALAGPPPKPKRRVWRSADIKGFLRTGVAQDLAAAMASLPVRDGSPAIDEEAWWKDVLDDPRVRTSGRNRIDDKDTRNAHVRVDRCAAESVTFTCALCHDSQTYDIPGLILKVGSDRNIYTINAEVMNCPDKRKRREGWGCPITMKLDPP